MTTLKLDLEFEGILAQGKFHTKAVSNTQVMESTVQVVYQLLIGSKNHNESLTLFDINHMDSPKAQLGYFSIPKD